MANIGHGKKFEQMKEKLLSSALKLFVQKGYKKTKITDVTESAMVDNNAVARVFVDKETFFLSVVENLEKAQNKQVKRLLTDKNDPLLEYFMQRAIRFAMAEYSEELREVVSSFYEKRKTSADKILQESLTQIGKEESYIYQVAISGIMCNFLATPCSDKFSLSDKIRSFTSFTLKLIGVEEGRAKQIINYVASAKNIAQIEKAAQDLIQEIVEN